MATVSLRSDGGAHAHPPAEKKKKRVKAVRSRMVTRAEAGKSLAMEQRLANAVARASRGEGLVEITHLSDEETYALLFGKK